MVLFSRFAQPDWAGGGDPEREAKCRKHGVPRFGADPWFDDYDEAVAACNGTVDGCVCPMRQACLLAALINNEGEGVWGGLYPEQRRYLRRYVPREAWAFEEAPPREIVLELMPPRKRRKKTRPPGELRECA